MFRLKKGDIVIIKDDSTLSPVYGGSKRSIVSGTLVEQIFLLKYKHLFRIVELDCIFPDTNNNTVIQAITPEDHQVVIFIEYRYLQLYEKSILPDEIGPLLPSQKPPEQRSTIFTLSERKKKNEKIKRPEKETYRVEVICSNCGKFQHDSNSGIGFEIPKGTSTPRFLADKPCEGCGCKTLRARIL